MASGYERVSNFQYTEYYEECDGYNTHVTDWQGADITDTTTISPATYCEPEIGPTTITRASTTATTYSLRTQPRRTISAERRTLPTRRTLWGI